MPLIELKDIHKIYRLGEVDLPVLKGISLEIERGEFVALMGASGSGKTTLLNLLGGLDRPTSGVYRHDRIEVSTLSRKALAAMRSRHVGFVFQSFNLLSRTSALDNVMMPTAYGSPGESERDIRRRSRELLDMVGLGARIEHSPAQLSGGEQQRVAIARALVNEPTLLLADEPTGNLDSRTGREILELFRRLNAERNITLILVTHDPEVARHADRVVKILDGRIVDDTARTRGARPSARENERPAARGEPAERGTSLRPLSKAFRIGLQALRRNVLRTALTMLGVIIGVAAVIAMMEISQGASNAIRLTVSNMGANTLLVSPGATASRGVSLGGGTAATLTPQDAEAIERDCDSVRCAAPVVRARGQVVYGNRNWVPVYIIGTTRSFLQARNWTELDLGRAFNDREVRSGAKVCLIGQTLVRELFGERYPIGEELRVENVPFKVIGVLSRKGANLLGVDQDDILLAPWTTIKYRISGTQRSDGGEDQAAPRPGRVSLPGRLPGAQTSVRSESVDQILVQAVSHAAVPSAVAEITQLLRDRHRLSTDENDFRVRDMAEVSDALKKTVRLLTALVLSVAAVSLIVGGVGIMNIMLVSVTERTREIGLRMAVGANAGHILRQFLVEAVVLCLLGGLIGIVVGRGGSLLVGAMMAWPTQASAAAALVAVVVSVTVGITFGYYPAWKASRLNPIDALRYE